MMIARRTSQRVAIRNSQQQGTSVNKLKPPNSHQLRTTKKRKSEKCQQQPHQLKLGNWGHQQARTVKRRKTEAKPDWLHLPRDVMFIIFSKIGVLQILMNAQNVCSLWRELAKDPLLYRSLDFFEAWKYFRFRDQSKFDYIFEEAVRRSCGQIFKLSCGDFTMACHINYVNRSISNSLRYLHLGRQSVVTFEVLVDIVKDLGMLEEFRMCAPVFPHSVVEQIGRSCPNLTSFRLCIKHQIQCVSFEEEACNIAQNMPRLRTLSLVGCGLTSKGLQTILDGCLCLERLDLRHSKSAKVSKEVFKRCSDRIRHVSLPDNLPFPCKKNICVNSNN